MPGGGQTLRFPPQHGGDPWLVWGIAMLRVRCRPRHRAHHGRYDGSLRDLVDELHERVEHLRLPLELRREADPRPQMASPTADRSHVSRTGRSASSWAARTPVRPAHGSLSGTSRSWSCCC